MEMYSPALVRESVQYKLSFLLIQMVSGIHLVTAYPKITCFFFEKCNESTPLANTLRS